MEKFLHVMTKVLEIVMENLKPFVLYKITDIMHAQSLINNNRETQSYKMFVENVLLNLELIFILI